MQLLLPHINRPFHVNRRQPVLAGGLIVRIHLLRECFPGGTLPIPADKVITAWDDLPNITVDNLSTFMKTGEAFLRAPPPTPTGLDMDRPISIDASSDACHDDNDGWLVVNSTTVCTSEVEEPQAPECSTTEGNDSMARGNSPDQSLDGRISDQKPSRSPGNNSPSSDEESLSSTVGGSPIPVGFDNIVHQWLLDYRARGTDAFIESLIAYAVVSVGTARQASRIARAMVKKLKKVSFTEGKNLENGIRFTVLTTFKRLWRNDTSTEGPSARVHAITIPSTPHGINIASFVGGLFDQKILTAKDIYLCLALLLEGDKRFDSLCAMHALLIQANDKLCKNRNLPALMQFRDSIAAISKESGEYLWVTGPHSRMILTDTLNLIERWTVSQTIKRETNEIYFRTGHRTIRNSAVGPRLRNGPPVEC